MEDHIYLVHHGIRGQKWGVRNGPPYPLDESDHSLSEKKAGWRGSLARDSKVKDVHNGFHAVLKNDHQRSKQSYEKELSASEKHGFTEEQKKQFVKIVVGTAAVVGVGTAIYFGYKHASIKKMAGLAQTGNLTRKKARSVMLQTLSDGDQVLRQGDVVHRMSAYANIDYSQATDPLYVSFRDADVASYMTLLKDWSGTGQRFDVTLEAVKDLRIPSEKKARQIFEDLWNSDPIYKQKLQETVENAYIKLGLSPSAAKALVTADLKNDPFSVAVYSIVKRQEDTAMFTRKLRDAGYDALIDYFDRGTMADEPLIVLDPAGSLRKTGERLVTRQVKIDTLLDLQNKGIDVLPGTGISVQDALKDVHRGRL